MEVDVENEIVTIANKSFGVKIRKNDIFLEIELPELLDIDFTINDFDERLYLKTSSPDGFGSDFFNYLDFFKSDNKINFSFRCTQQPNKRWKGQYDLSAFLATLAGVASESSDFDIDIESLHIDDWEGLELSFVIESDFNCGEIISKYSSLLKDLIKRTELILSRAIWKKEYEKNEKLFSTEILFPLLIKMGFIDVRYNHGVREYGKDFTFSEHTKFGNLRHFAIQVKAGDMRGNVNSDIDEIIGQLKDTFSMPYYEVSANEWRNISIFIIAISGYFTENAKDKINMKIPQYFKGCVYLLDKDKIMGLIERYWE